MGAVNDTLLGCKDTGGREAGGTKVKLTVYPEAGHDSWTKTYFNPDLYVWLLKHRRIPTSSPAATTR